MRHLWHRFLAPLTPGVRWILAWVTLFYIVGLAGIFSRTYNLYPWLGLSGPLFRSGRVWALITYPLLPASILDFAFNWILLLVIGSWIERVWSRRKLWAYCLICSMAAGVLHVLIRPSSPGQLVGTTPAVFGLLAAWGHLFGGEKVLFWFIWEMSIRQAALIMAVASYVMMLVSCPGPVNATMALGGGVAGLIFLWVEGRIVRSRAGIGVASQRIGRLEI